MRITHIAIQTKQLEELRSFYITYFNGTSNEKYCNPAKGFESYFIHFDGDTSIELMRRPDIREHTEQEQAGICHLAFSLGSREEVIALTEKLRKEGFPVVGEPRTTGDGYFESIILDPDGNRIELVG